MIIEMLQCRQAKDPCPRSTATPVNLPHDVRAHPFHGSLLLFLCARSVTPVSEAVRRPKRKEIDVRDGDRNPREPSRRGLGEVLDRAE